MKEIKKIFFLNTNKKNLLPYKIIHRTFIIKSGASTRCMLQTTFKAYEFFFLAENVAKLAAGTPSQNINLQLKVDFMFTDPIGVPHFRAHLINNIFPVRKILLQDFYSCYTKSIGIENSDRIRIHPEVGYEACSDYRFLLEIYTAEKLAYIIPHAKIFLTGDHISIKNKYPGMDQSNPDFITNYTLNDGTSKDSYFDLKSGNNILSSISNGTIGLLILQKNSENIIAVSSRSFNPEDIKSFYSKQARILSTLGSEASNVKIEGTFKPVQTQFLQIPTQEFKIRAATTAMHKALNHIIINDSEFNRSPTHLILLEYDPENMDEKTLYLISEYEKNFLKNDADLDFKKPSNFGKFITDTLAIHRSVNPEIARNIKNLHSSGDEIKETIMSAILK